MILFHTVGVHSVPDRMHIRQICLLECRKFKGGYYELWGGVLDSSYCYADGPDDYYPDADDGWLPEFDSFDNLEEQDGRDYDDYLPTLGFIQVDIANYVSQIGDIVVHEALEGHPYGHIAMFDGNDWISDFIQRDMFGGNAYRENQDYTI